MERPKPVILPNFRAMLRHPLSSRRRKALRAALVDGPEYEAWIARYDTLDERDRQRIAADIARFDPAPRLSILMPVYDTPMAYLRAAIESALGQLYPFWELCIADDASPNPEIRRLLKDYADADPRIRIVERAVRGGISAASNSALGLAGSDWVALFDHDDTLAPHALYSVAAEIVAHPDAAMLFSDEDAINDEGRRFRPLFKPDWNAELMLGQNVFSHLGVFRTADIRRLGGFRAELDGSQDWDLALRVADAVGPQRIRHIPHILYHWRQSGRGADQAQFSRRHAVRAAEAAGRAVQEHLARAGQKAVVVAGEAWQQVLWPVPSPPPRVTVIMLAEGDKDNGRAAERLLAATDYPLLEVLLVGGAPRSSPPTGTGARRIRRLASPAGSNPAILRNAAVDAATGDIVVFLDAHLAPSGATWLAELVGQAVRPEVGAVGPLVIDRSGRILHGGLLLSADHIAAPAHRGWRGNSRGYEGRALLAQDLSAVSIAGMATRRDVYRAAGGLDPELPWHYGDVDYCLRLRRAGSRIIWTPRSRLRQTRRADGQEHGGREEERAIMRARWAPVLEHDPAGNPNLADDGSYALAFPPRVEKPWRKAENAAEK
jgi:glycosyltransferase involved in cell wall biosynthesis